MRTLVLAVAFLFAALVTPLTAQCTPLGTPCASSGMNLVCGSPQVGTNWVMGEQNGAACGGSISNPIPMFTALGSCFDLGIPLNPPLVCNHCTGCLLHVIPIDVVLQWSWPPRTVTVPIPNNRYLIGAMFCIQNFCVDTTSLCICASGAAQVVIVP